MSMRYLKTQGVHHVHEVLEIILNPSTTSWTLPSPRFYVREGVQHVPEVLEIILNRFPIKNKAEMMYDMKKKKIHQLHTSWTPPSPR